MTHYLRGLSAAVLTLLLGGSPAWANNLEEQLGLEFVTIPAGSFIMGGPEDKVVPNERNREKPRHKVTISRPFEFGRYEVTQRQWKLVMGELPKKLRKKSEFNERFTGDDKPVMRLTWEEAQAFIARLNEQLATDVYRMPTEAEWEYAARAGTDTEYFFGDDPAPLGEYAWYARNSDGKSHPVGQKKPNPWGLYDIYGNAGEWTSDRYIYVEEYNYYANSPEVDPQGPARGEKRIVRGGDWRRPPFELRSAKRSYDPPTHGNFCHGLRLVREIR